MSANVVQVAAGDAHVPEVITHSLKSNGATEPPSTCGNPGATVSPHVQDKTQVNKLAAPANTSEEALKAIMSKNDKWPYPAELDGESVDRPLVH